LIVLHKFCCVNKKPGAKIGQKETGEPFTGLEFREFIRVGAIPYSLRNIAIEGVGDNVS
jgi:hypothetical protein